jgi:fucose 4-O-acetylase-like acetyltransferase
MNKKVYEYDILRIIAIIFVVIGHSAYLQISSSYGGVNYSLPENISAVYYSNIFKLFRFLASWVYKFHMPLFFLLSGAVYNITENQTINLDTLIIKKVKRLIIPYFLAGLFFMFPIKIISGFYNLESIFPALNLFFYGGDSGHLWFLLALFWIFALFFILNKYIGKKSILILLIITYIIQQKQYLINFDMFSLKLGLTYIFWFSLGYCFEIIRNKINLTAKWIFFLISLLIVAIDYSRGYFIDGFLCIIIYSFCTYLFADLIYFYFPKLINAKPYNILSKNIMFIYLLHDPLEYVCLKFTFNYNLLIYGWGCYFYLLFRIIGVTFISILIGEAFTRIKNKFLFLNIHTINN